ncbi:MAG: hypothetical protein QOK28_1629 [Actinomycetota bacterium]|jgi:dienelactone hydrolase
MLRELDVAYDVEGVEMIGSLIVEDRETGPRPSVLLFGGGTGFAPFHRQRARALADLGYCVFGADYFGGGRVLEGAALDAARAAMTPDHRKALGLGAFNALVARAEGDADRVAALGYCFGGGVAVQLAQAGAALKAVVGFHPGIGPTPTPEDNANISGAVLMCCGTADPLVPVEKVIAWLQQMTDSGVDCTVELYSGVGHVFTDPEADSLGYPGIAYDKRSDERSWASMLRLLSTTIGAPA